MDAIPKSQSPAFFTECPALPLQIPIPEILEAAPFVTVDDVEEQAANAQLGKFAVTHYPLDIAHIIYDNVFYQMMRDALCLRQKCSRTIPPR